MLSFVVFFQHILYLYHFFTLFFISELWRSICFYPFLCQLHFTTNMIVLLFQWFYFIKRQITDLEITTLPIIRGMSKVDEKLQMFQFVFWYSIFSLRRNRSTLYFSLHISLFHSLRCTLSTLFSFLSLLSFFLLFFQIERWIFCWDFWRFIDFFAVEKCSRAILHWNTTAWTFSLFCCLFFIFFGSFLFYISIFRLEWPNQEPEPLIFHLKWKF